MEGELPLQWCVCAGVPGSIDPDHGNDPGLLAPPQASSYSLPAPGMHKLKLWGEVQGRGQSQLWQQHPTLLQWGHPLTLCSVLQRQPDRPSFLCCFFFFFFCHESLHQNPGLQTSGLISSALPWRPVLAWYADPAPPVCFLPSPAWLPIKP